MRRRTGISGLGDGHFLINPILEIAATAAPIRLIQNWKTQAK